MEQDQVIAQERINSLMKICQLQQQFQENWEEEQESLKNYIDNKLLIGGNIGCQREDKDKSLIGELDHKF